MYVLLCTCMGRGQRHNLLREMSTMLKSYDTKKSFYHFYMIQEGYSLFTRSI